MISLKSKTVIAKKKHSQVLSIFFLKIFAKACRIYKAHWKDENINRLKGSHKVYRPRPRLASIEQARKHFEGKAIFFSFKNHKHSFFIYIHNPVSFWRPGILEECVHISGRFPDFRLEHNNPPKMAWGPFLRPNPLTLTSALQSFFY